MTPTRERPILTFMELKSVCRLEGITTLVNTCRRSAPNVRTIVTISSSVLKKPFSISSTVTINEIASAITMMACIPAPTQTIKTGPSAILGRALSTTKNGSQMRESVFDHHNSTARPTPSTVPSKNPISVSIQVTPRWVKSPFSPKLSNVFTMRDGWLIIKLSITPILAKISHIASRMMTTEICIVRIIYFFRFCFCR